MCHMFWGLFLWCFPYLRNCIPSVSSLQWFFFLNFFFNTSVGYSHCFIEAFSTWFTFYWNWTWCSESLVQQAEPKLFHVLFLWYLHFIHLSRIMSVHTFFIFWGMFSINPRFFGPLPLNMSLGRTLPFVLLCSWLLLPICSVKLHITSGDFCTSFKWLSILSSSVKVLVTVPDYSLLT